MKYLLLLLLFTFLAPIKTRAFEAHECDSVYDKTKQLIAKHGENMSQEEKINHLVAVVGSMVNGTEQYLNTCTDHNQSIVSQDQKLSRLSELALLSCKSRRASTQVIDVHGNNTPSLILHTVLSPCEDRQSIYDSGFSALFIFNSENKTWQGYPLWPIELLEGEVLQNWMLYYPQYRPKVYMLPFMDKTNRRFMAIESNFQGADHLSNMLSIIRWQDDKYKKVVELELSDWCGQPNQWEISNSGRKVIVPEASATDRCEKREQVVYPLELQ